MAVAVFFVVAAFIGISFLYLLKIPFWFEEKIFWSAFFGIILISFSVFFIGLIWKFTSFSILLSIGTILLVLCILVKRRWEYLSQQFLADWASFKQRLETKGTIAFIVLMILATFFFSLFWIKIFHTEVIGDSTVFKISAVWFDWTAHLTFVSHFAYKNHISLEHPLISGQPLSYHFMADFLSAILMKIGVGIVPAFVVPGFFFSLTLVVSIFSFALRLANKIAVAILSVIFFILGGGFGFFYFFRAFDSGWLNYSLNPIPYHDIFHIPWTPFLPQVFFQQRAFEFGFPYTFLVFTLMLIGLAKDENRRLLSLAGFFAAFLPVIQMQSALVVALTGFLLIIVRPWRGIKLTVQRVLSFYLPFGIFSIWEVPIFVSIFLRATAQMPLKFGWLLGQDNFWIFWVRNLGLFFILTPIAFLFVSRSLKFVYLAFLPLFILPNITILQPFEFDNIKILEYWFLATTVIVAAFIIDMWKGSLIKKIFITLTVPIFILTGILDTGVFYFQRQVNFFSDKDLNFAQLLRAQIPEDAYVLTASNYDHIIPRLVGRKIIRGLNFFLWGYGYGDRTRERDVREIYEGGFRAKELLQDYKINYVYLGPSERYEFIVDESFFNKNYPLIFQKGEVKLYKID